MLWPAQLQHAFGTGYEFGVTIEIVRPRGTNERRRIECDFGVAGRPGHLPLTAKTGAATFT
jgi:hypothetical protein